MSEYATMSHQELFRLAHSGDPGRLFSAGDHWHRVSADMSELKLDLEHALAGLAEGWQGQAADAFQQQGRAVGEKIGQVVTRSRALGDGLHAMGDALGEARAQMPAPPSALEAGAEEALSGAAHGGTAGALAGGPLGGLIGVLAGKALGTHVRAQHNQAVRVMQELGHKYTTATEKFRSGHALDDAPFDPPRESVSPLPDDRPDIGSGKRPGHPGDGEPSSGTSGVVDPSPAGDHTRLAEMTAGPGDRSAQPGSGVGGNDYPPGSAGDVPLPRPAPTPGRRPERSATEPSPWRQRQRAAERSSGVGAEASGPPMRAGSPHEATNRLGTDSKSTASSASQEGATGMPMAPSTGGVPDSEESRRGRRPHYLKEDPKTWDVLDPYNPPVIE